MKTTLFTAALVVLASVLPSFAQTELPRSVAVVPFVAEEEVAAGEEVVGIARDAVFRAFSWPFRGLFSKSSPCESLCHLRKSSST